MLFDLVCLWALIGAIKISKGLESNYTTDSSLNRQDEICSKWRVNIILMNLQIYLKKEKAVVFMCIDMIFDNY